MSVVAAELIIYGSANMPENDADAAGGAIATSVRIVPDSASLFNTLNDTVEVVSDAAGDTTQTVTVYGRNTGGSLINEVINLNGTTVVNGATTFERIEKIVVSAAHTGAITVRKATGDTAIVIIESGVLTIRRPFYNVSADVSGGSARVFYEKVFYKNTNGTNALLAAAVTESADPEAQVEFALEDAVNDNEATANRLTAPTGISAAFSSAAKNVPGTDLAAGAAIGVWLKLSLPAGDPATKTTYTLQLAGSTT